MTLPIEEPIDVLGEPVEPQEPQEPGEPGEPQDGVIPGQEPVVEPAPQQKQSPEENAAFAKARKHFEEELQRRDTQVAEQYGHLGIKTYDELMETLAKQRREEEAKELATKEGMSEELAFRLVTQEKELADMKKRDALRDVQTRNLQQMNDLKDKPYFADLKAEIEEDIKNPNVDPETAYAYRLGKRAPELIEKAKKEKEAEVMKNLQLKKQGKTSPAAAPNVKPSQAYTSTKAALDAAWDNLE